MSRDAVPPPSAVIRGPGAAERGESSGIDSDGGRAVAIAAADTGVAWGRRFAICCACLCCTAVVAAAGIGAKVLVTLADAPH